MSVTETLLVFFLTQRTVPNVRPRSMTLRAADEASESVTVRPVSVSATAGPPPPETESVSVRPVSVTAWLRVETSESVTARPVSDAVSVNTVPPVSSSSAPEPSSRTNRSTPSSWR